MHEKFIDRCIELALLGKADVAPNPMVGSVIVHEGKIIGEGYHMKCGGPHAEVNAINSVSDDELLKNSTIYINLEPCSHYGRTPPCSILILEKQIPRVVVGCIDTFSKVSGKGVEMLQKGGCEVIVGVKEKECIELNKRFFTYHSKTRPYVILKWAETKDGFIDVLDDGTESPKGIWITNNLARVLVHKWRSEESAILVGTKTAQKDNPKLNVREWTGKSPLRLVIDRNLTLDKSLNIFDKSIPTIVYNNKGNDNFDNLEYVNIDFENLPCQILQDLNKRDILSVIVEGGTVLLKSFIDEGLWDEARVFIGGISFGDGVKAPVIKGKIMSTEYIGNCKLDRIINSEL